DLDGRRRQLEARVTPSGTDEVTAIVRDFTEQRAVEAELRRSSARIVAAADEAAAELKRAIAELRELARGIHPAILTEAGLASAVTALADRSTVPATVTATPDR